MVWRFGDEGDPQLSLRQLRPLFSNYLLILSLGYQFR